jgi:hypothetical protein
MANERVRRTLYFEKSGFHFQADWEKFRFGTNLHCETGPTSRITAQKSTNDF